MDAQLNSDTARDPVMRDTAIILRPRESAGHGWQRNAPLPVRTTRLQPCPETRLRGANMRMKFSDPLTEIYV